MKKKSVWFVWLFGFFVLLSAFWSLSRNSEKSLVYCSGRVLLEPALIPNAQEIRTLFLVLYDASNNSPMPYGAQKIPLSQNPEAVVARFILTKDNLQLMNPNAPVPSILKLKARLDLDGTGGKDKKGDLTGMLSNIKLGTQDLSLAIDTVVR